jgi:hypothetical protein
MNDPAHDSEELVAQHLVDELANRLASGGYHFVCVTVAKVIPSGTGRTGLTAPGASVINMSSPLIAPALPHLARTLRGLADMADAEFKRTGVAEAAEAYAYDVSKVRA